LCCGGKIPPQSLSGGTAKRPRGAIAPLEERTGVSDGLCPAGGAIF
jgi:hypothetical protein